MFEKSWFWQSTANTSETKKESSWHIWILNRTPIHTSEQYRILAVTSDSAKQRCWLLNRLRLREFQHCSDVCIGALFNIQMCQLDSFFVSDVLAVNYFIQLIHWNTATATVTDRHQTRILMRQCDSLSLLFFTLSWVVIFFNKIKHQHRTRTHMKMSDMNFMNASSNMLLIF